MEKYTYKTYPRNFVATTGNREEERVAQATVNFNCVGQACYTISVIGRMQSIEFEDNCPYPSDTLEKSAQLHIEALIAEDTKAASKTPTA